MYSKTLPQENSLLSVQMQLLFSSSSLYACTVFSLVFICPGQKPFMSPPPHTHIQSIHKYFTCKMGQPLSSDSVQAPISFLLDFTTSYPTDPSVFTYPPCLLSEKLPGTVSNLSQVRAQLCSELSRSLPFPSGFHDSVWSALFTPLPSQMSLLVVLHPVFAFSTPIFSETFTGLNPLPPSPGEVLSIHTL